MAETRITLDETHLTLAQAGRQVPSQSGNGVNPATVWRWASRGCRGIKLETILVGGIRYTSREALERFITATTAAADGTVVPVRTTRQREAAIAAAERELAQA